MNSELQKIVFFSPVKFVVNIGPEVIKVVNMLAVFVSGFFFIVENCMTVELEKTIHRGQGLIDLHSSLFGMVHKKRIHVIN